MEPVSEIVEDEETHLVNTMEIEEGIVEMEETQLVNTLKSMLQTLPILRTEGCIYRVPYELRRENEEAYTPLLVSIGPFHHGNESLQEMDVQKQRYLHDFLKRTPDLDLEYYVRILKAFEKRARNCYTGNIDHPSNDFIKMMLLDGCFIVEFLIKLQYVEERNNDDPIFKSYVMISGIIRDMTLLENQLPFFILEHLFNLILIDELRRFSFLEITINTINILIDSSDKWIELSEATYQAKHMVDLCLQYYTPTATETELPPKTAGGIIRILNASKLHESGVKFTKCPCSSVKCLLDVKFTNGNLEIPSVMFAHYTETFLRNLIAYEQCDIGNTKFFSEYIRLMDSLIDTPNDVQLLTKAGIIENILGDNEEVSKIVNNLGSGDKFGSDSYLGRLIEDVNDYSHTRWNVWMAKLKRNLFYAPWRSIFVVVM